MGDRIVTHTRKDADGNIIAICNPRAQWYERSKEQAIEDIENEAYRYYAEWFDIEPTLIHVVRGEGDPYLRTDRDDTPRNNLDKLPDCTIPADETIRELAPVVRFHPEEVYLPMDPLGFIQNSRFRHHRANGDDQGYNKKLKKWRTNKSGHENYYDIPVDFINSYDPHPNGKNRRPRDSNRGERWNVFLQPRGRKPQGEPQPDGAVPVFYFAKNESTTPHGNGVVLIQYWWFFGYNDGFLSQNHQGDWEHASAVLKDGELIGAYMSAHGGSDFYSKESLAYEGEHFVVYSAKGSHASYPERGSFHTILGVDDTADGGQSLRTWSRLEPLGTQPWKDFAGAWGKVGEISDTTGPLGPWHKRWSNL